VKSNAESDFFNYFVLSSRAIANSRRVSAFFPKGSKHKAIIWLKNVILWQKAERGFALKVKHPKIPIPYRFHFSAKFQHF